MSRTVIIEGSDEVMAELGRPGTYYRGKWQNIRVIGVGSDEWTPLEVRQSLVGLVIPTIFTAESEALKIPRGSRLAYAPDVIQCLMKAGKSEAVRLMERDAPNPLDMYVFEREIYELV